MNFLTEHKIEQYADLVSRIEEISAENEKTADALKSVAKRLADMAVLMKHVATYQKTKPVYEVYRLSLIHIFAAFRVFLRLLQNKHFFAHHRAFAWKDLLCSR